MDILIWRQDQRGGAVAPVLASSFNPGPIMKVLPMSDSQTVEDEVVIARYNEDLDWIAEIPACFRVVVYNKGQAIESEQVKKRADEIVALPNRGRESDTFLRHVLHKTTFTTGFTVFLQGDPFEHSPDILRLLEAKAHWADLQPLSWQWIAAEALPPQDILARETGQFVGNCRVRTELFSLSTWQPLQFNDPGAKRIYDQYRSMHNLPDGLNIASDMLARCGWTGRASDAAAHLVGRFSYGALFAVRQKRLSEAPGDALERAIEAANSHQMYGYVLERLWLHLFGEPFVLPTHATTMPALPDYSRTPRFIPAAVQRGKQPIYRRVVPAVKRRIVAWAES